jgi:hypothetical protein
VSTEQKYSDRELDAILERLRAGDRRAMDLVTPENLIALLNRAEGDDNLVRQLRKKL